MQMREEGKLAFEGDGHLTLYVSVGLTVTWKDVGFHRLTASISDCEHEILGQRFCDGVLLASVLLLGMIKSNWMTTHDAISCSGAETFSNHVILCWIETGGHASLVLFGVAAGEKEERREGGRRR